MRKYLIATHRKMAEGIVDTLKFFAGDIEIQALSAYVDDNELKDEKILSYIKLAAEDELVIFTDLEAGSITQKFFPYLKNKNIYMVTGINMPLILSVVLAETETLSHEMLDRLISQAKDQMKQVYFESKNSMEDE